MVIGYKDLASYCPNKRWASILPSAIHQSLSYGSGEDSNLATTSVVGITVDLRPGSGKDRQTGLRALPLSYTAKFEDECIFR